MFTCHSKHEGNWVVFMKELGVIILLWNVLIHSIIDMVPMSPSFSP